MKIKFHRFNKNVSWQWSKLEKIFFGHYEISLGRVWVEIDFN